MSCKDFTKWLKAMEDEMNLFKKNEINLGIG